VKPGKKRSRKHWRSALILIAAIALVETGSFGALKALHLYWGQSVLAEYTRVANFNPLGWNKELLSPHPFFGPVMNKGKPSDSPEFRVNDFGFFSSHEYPYRKRPGDFVIGILGGSFASDFAVDADLNGLLAELSERNPALSGKNIVVLNLAIAAAKQPQQFFVASYFLPMIDLALNIDGAAETPFERWQIPRYPPPPYPLEYPILYHVVEGPGRPTFLEHLEGRAIDNLSGLVARLALWIPPLQWSNGYFLLLSGCLRMENLVHAHLENEVQSRTEDGPPHPIAWDPTDPRAQDRAAVGIWERYTRLEHGIARFEHVKTVFFLQPSPMVLPSKPFSPEEQRFMKSEPPERLPTHTESFQLLRDRASKLRQSGIPIFDLSDIYAKTEETVYTDSCCHVNHRGNEILAARILNILTKLGPSILPEARE
jgi:hypothetical protein